MSRKEQVPGSEKFNSFYSAIYGDRWEQIRQAFSLESRPVLLPGLEGEPYYMDEASMTCASMLPVKPGDKVLDMCAAPGGKSLTIALRLDGDGLLVSNDRSAPRRARLANVMKSSLSERQSAIVKVTGHDSSTWGLFEQNVYDCVLLDAPCSSERHVFNDPKALELWGTNRPKMLAIQQFAMLAAALEAVKPGGYILYSTCSINPGENQDVIAKLYRKRSGAFDEIDCPDAACSEKLEHGRIIMPDTSDGHGPMYFCLIRKKDEEPTC